MVETDIIFMIVEVMTIAFILKKKFFSKKKLPVQRVVLIQPSKGITTGKDLSPSYSLPTASCSRATT